METVYRKSYSIDGSQVDCFGKFRPANLLGCIQDASVCHATALGLSWEALASRRMFWAVVRHRVQLERIPKEGETVTLETWPCPATRVAYPRAVVGYDGNGNPIFRAITLWVLMDMDSRAMILPGNSGVTVPGVTRGLELDAPASLHPVQSTATARRVVCFSDLDKNGHMNNIRPLAWGEDLLPSAFHREHSLSELVICYHNEAREGQALDVRYQLAGGNCLQMELCREEPDGRCTRLVSLRGLYREAR